MFKKEKKEEEKKPEAEKSAEEKSPAFTIPLGEKKAEKPFIEKFQEALKKTDIVLAEEQTILKDLFLEVYRGYRRNHVINLFLQRKFVANKKDVGAMQALSQVQMDIKSQEEYLLYLLSKISS